MYSTFILSLLFLVSISRALPSLKPRSFSGVAHLNPEYQSKWYSQSLSTPESPPLYPTPESAPVNPSHYQCFGPLITDLPSYDKWPLSFGQLWQINVPEITKSNGGTEYNEPIKTAILTQSKKNKLDPRFILAMILQESTGNVHVPCTNTFGPPDCGLLQIGGGRNFSGVESIAGMIQDGIEGTESVPGLLNYFNGEGVAWLGDEGFWKGNPFAAAHIYNVGSIGGEDLTKADGQSCNAYAHDLAARLWGWDGAGTGCEASKLCPGLEGRVCY